MQVCLPWFGVIIPLVHFHLPFVLCPLKFNGSWNEKDFEKTLKKTFRSLENSEKDLLLSGVVFFLAELLSAAQLPASWVDSVDGFVNGADKLGEANLLTVYMYMFLVFVFLSLRVFRGCERDSKHRLPSLACAERKL